MRLSRSKLIVIAVGLLLLGYAGLSLWRSARVEAVYADDKPAAPAVTQQHIAALRQLRFAWNPLIEGGGPTVDPQAPYGSEDLAPDLAPILGTRDLVAIARFHREVSTIFIQALKVCSIAPGRYKLTHLDNAWMEQRLRGELKGLPSDRVNAIVEELPKLSADRQFELTDQHRRLLRGITFEWQDEGVLARLFAGAHPVPAVDFKRPFGDATDFEADMASILALPRLQNGTSDPLLAQLYWEMWPALQAFVENAPFEDCLAPA